MQLWRWLVRVLTGVDIVLADIAAKEAVRQRQQRGYERGYEWEG